MTNALAKTPQLEYQLTVLNGPDKGSAYRLVATKVIIGRGAECDIVLREDNKVSRTHAQIAVTHDEVEVIDISDRNRVLVNGEESRRQKLEHNTVIQLGETKLQFKFIEAPNSGGGLQLAIPHKELKVAAEFIKQQAVGLKKKVRKPNGQPSLVPIIVIMAVITGIGYMLTSKGKPAVQPPKIGTEEDILRQRTTLDQEISAIVEERKKNGEDTELYTQAQSHYIKGFRDYNNGQYERAIESFKACLALMPTHRNCQQYYNDAERQWGQVINDQIILGLRHKSQNQYAACIAAFKNVIVAVKVRTDRRYIDAEMNIKYCEAKQGNRY